MKQEVVGAKEQTDKSIIILRDFNTPFSITDRLNRQNQQGYKSLEQHYQQTSPNL